MSELLRVSYHEAGHLICAYVLGCAMLDAEVHPSGAGVARAVRDPGSVEAGIMIAMAGAVSEKLFCGSNEIGDAADRMRVQEIADQLSLDDFDVKWLRRKTRNLLRDNARAVKSVARALISRRRLDGGAIEQRINLYYKRDDSDD